MKKALFGYKWYKCKWMCNKTEIVEAFFGHCRRWGRGNFIIRWCTCKPMSWSSHLVRRRPGEGQGKAREGPGAHKQGAGLPGPHSTLHSLALLCLQPHWSRRSSSTEPSFFRIATIPGHVCQVCFLLDASFVGDAKMLWTWAACWPFVNTSVLSAVANFLVVLKFVSNGRIHSTPCH